MDRIEKGTWKAPLAAVPVALGLTALVALIAKKNFKFEQFQLATAASLPASYGIGLLIAYALLPPKDVITMSAKTADVFSGNQRIWEARTTHTPANEATEEGFWRHVDRLDHIEVCLTEDLASYREGQKGQMRSYQQSNAVNEQTVFLNRRVPPQFDKDFKRGYYVIKSGNNYIELAVRNNEQREQLFLAMLTNLHSDRADSLFEEITAVCSQGILSGITHAVYGLFRPHSDWVNDVAPKGGPKYVIEIEEHWVSYRGEISYHVIVERGEWDLLAHGKLTARSDEPGIDIRIWLEKVPKERE